MDKVRDNLVAILFIFVCNVEKDLNAKKDFKIDWN